MKVYPSIFQTIRATVTKTRSSDTRHPKFLVAPRRICRMDPAVCLVSLESSRDLRSLFRRADWINHGLSDFPIPSVGQVSWAADRPIIKAVDGRLLSPSSEQMLIGAHRPLFARLGGNTNTMRICTRNTETSCAPVNYFSF